MSFNVTVFAGREGWLPVASVKKSDELLTRTLNIFVALIALFLLAPLMLLVSCAIYISDPGPILFGHRRLGRGGETFRCWKFRSMVVDAEARLADLLASDPQAKAEWLCDRKLRNDPRISGIGHFLRKSSLDELPQLFNVLAGQMSLVGPRPIVEDEIPLYGRYFEDYCSVLPGITGLWQVSGRNNVSYRRRVALDVFYARSRNFWLDCRLLAVTVPAVLLAKGSY